VGAVSAGQGDGRQKQERTRAAIFEAAAKVVGSRGYAAVTLNDIATEANLKAGSLYYHFDSKEALVAAVLRFTIERTSEEVRADVDALGPDATAGERLRAAIRAHMWVGYGPYRAAYVRMISQVSPEVRRNQFRVEREYGEYWAKLFDDAFESGDIRSDVDPVAARLLVIGAINWMVEWPPAALKDPDRIAETIEKLVFEGLDPRVREHPGSDGKQAHAALDNK
jgi:AcrR family transcriptional regulator